MKSWVKKILVVSGIGCVLTAAADDFEDLIHACERCSNNYYSALNAQNSRYSQEYLSHLEYIKEISFKVQKTIQKMQLGKDYNFPKLADTVEKIYQEQVRVRKEKQHVSKNRLGKAVISPDGVFKILLTDIKSLRKMKFTTDDGGSIRPSLETRRRIMEFQRLKDFFNSNWRSTLSNSDLYVKEIFDDRCARMKMLALELSEVVQQKYPNARAEYSLKTETDHLLDCYSKLKRENKRKFDSSNKRKRNPKKHNALDDRTSSANVTDLHYALRNIQSVLNRWNQTGFQSDPPLQGKLSGRETPEEIMGRTPDRKKNYEKKSSAELLKLVQARRKEILRNNSLMDGIDQRSERLFLKTLTSAQRSAYNKELRSLRDDGYESRVAVHTAIQKINARLLLEEKIPPKKDLIRILVNLDNEDQKKEDGKDLKFDLKKSTYKDIDGKSFNR